MKRRLWVITGYVLSAIMLLGVPIYASDVSGAIYQADVSVTNTSYDASTVSVPFTLNTQALIDGYYVNSSLSNVALQTPVGTDIPFMPAVGSGDQWMMFAGEVAQTSSQNYVLYTGGSAMGGSICYFPGDGGMTTSDSASLELGNNFVVEWSGLFDTSSGSDKNLVYKSGAFKTYVSGVGEITCTIYGTNTVTEDLLPDGTGDYTNIASQNPGSGAHWDKVDDPTGSPDDATTTVYTTIGFPTFEYDAYNLQNTAIPTGSTINSVTVYFRGYSSGIGNAKPGLRLGGVESTGNAIGFTLGGGWQSSNQVISRPGGGSWTVTDLDSLQVVMGLARATTGNMYLTQVYVKISYEDPVALVTVTATGVSSGEHVIKVTADTTDLKIFIDAVEEDSALLSGASVLDNANNWTFLENYSMPYMDYQKIWVGGTLQQHIIWQNSATFTDQSANGHDTTPTFRTTSTDPDVSAALDNFGPAQQAQLIGFGTEVAPEMISSLPTMPDEMYTELDVDHLPGAALINTMLDAAGIPRSLFWFPAAFGLAAVLGLFVFAKTRSLLAMSVSSGAMVAFFSLMGIIPFWVVIPFAIIVVSVMIKQGTASW